MRGANRRSSEVTPGNPSRDYRSRIPQTFPAVSNNVLISIKFNMCGILNPYHQTGDRPADGRPRLSLATLVSWPNRGFFILVIVPDGAAETSRNGQPKRTGKNRRALRATPLPLLSPKPLLDYQIMDPGVLIPIAFLLADRKSVV